ncbi:hypothetical protein [Ancylobacter lacus]|uniref:hypothetical protein n=1 Tax=Ancylobacter lacus TaxID=2579970 RepID=UPI001BCADFC0|nr:hypothetical protein [Ancylobacter lacus]MBS7539714.1 hypothetical protein [Ancylobacter lacus]
MTHAFTVRTAPRLLAARIAGLCLAGFVALGAAPALAQEDVNLTEKLLTGIGLVAPTPPEIEYRERAPLVVPTNKDVLPPPRDPNTVTSNPAWPKDYDKEMAKREAAEQQATVGGMNSKQGGLNPAPLTPSELNKGYKNAKAQGSGFNNSKRETDNKLSLNELGFKGWSSVTSGDKPIVFTGEPERASLVQPPPGYQTPAPNAPYGVVEEKKKTWSLPSLFDRTQPNKEN